MESEAKKKPVTSRMVTDYVIECFKIIMRSYDANLEQGSDFIVSYNLDTRCYIIEYKKGAIYIKDHFFKATREALNSFGVNVHYVFIEVTEL